MKQNDRARKRLRDDLIAGESIAATVRLVASVSPPGTFQATMQAWASSRRTSHSYRYIDEFLSGVDIGQQFRHDLGEPWFTVTDQRALFHRWKSSAIRPTPGDLIDTCPIDDVTMHWTDTQASGVRYRMMVLLFADERFLLRYSPVGPMLRKNKNWDDEADAMVAAFGDRAERIDVPGSGD